MLLAINLTAGGHLADAVHDGHGELAGILRPAHVPTVLELSPTGSDHCGAQRKEPVLDGLSGSRSQGGRQWLHAQAITIGRRCQLTARCGGTQKGMD